MRNRMMALGLIGTLYFSVCSFRLTDNESTSNVASISPSKDKDVQAILNNLGVKTSVDQKALDAEYVPITLVANNTTGVKVAFNNPMAHPYNLTIFDDEGNLVASINNIIDAGVKLPTNLFNQGSYIYKLTGEGNVYAGKFYYH